MQTNALILLRNRWRKYGVVFGLWTLFALLSAVEAYVSHNAIGTPVPWATLLRRAFEEWYLWMVLSLGVIWLGNRFRYEAGRTVRWIFFHALASAITAVVYVLLYSWLMTGQHSVMDGTILTFDHVFKKVILEYFLFNATIYWIVLLAHHGWHYYQRFRERELQASALATELVSARLDLLRMQLNPHFLFNTLNAISALIHDNPKSADRMLVRLSELLRRTLQLGDPQEVPLSQELEFLKGYLEIEEVRFEDRLRVEFQVDPGLENMMVPSLILQPLVENAIRHGIEPREDMGRVIVSAHRSNGRLELKVSDNGTGLAEAETKPQGQGVGLSNTRSRLTHLYGSNHQFELNDVPGGGLEVRLIIPSRENPALKRLDAAERRSRQ